MSLKAVLEVLTVTALTPPRKLDTTCPKGTRPKWGEGASHSQLHSKIGLPKQLLRSCFGSQASLLSMMRESAIQINASL